MIKLKWNVKKAPHFYLDKASDFQINTDGNTSLSGSPELYVWAKCLQLFMHTKEINYIYKYF
jgi:hypothetical protein